MALFLPGLAALAPQIPDSASFHRFREGVPAEPPPIPGGVMTVLRAIFNAPTWAWVVGIVVGLTVGIWLALFLWRRRSAIGHWLTTRDRGVKIAMSTGAVLVLALLFRGGQVSWNFMQHDNAFCVGCHIMEGPWNKFGSDAGKHSALQCHDCHQQSLYASTRQLVLWVANKPVEIPPHAPVPNARCESCHAKDQSEAWTRIAQTAGHRVHLESDSSALEKVLCVTCHGKEVHAFIPANETCGSAGCHANLDIKLGRMATQSTLHCNQCHQFTAEVPRLATREDAADAMQPGSRQCFSCHAMRQVAGDFDPARDPHNGTCGTCHNPHTQTTPAEAGKTCSQCHADWQTVPFHTGRAHGQVGQQCLVCHNQHAARVDASDCVACHTSVTARFGTLRLRPPLPFDTTRALRTSARDPEQPVPPSVGHFDGARPPGPVAWPPRPAAAPAPAAEIELPGKGDTPPPELPAPDPPTAAAEPSIASVDSFPHARHTRLACITCHTTGASSATLTFVPPRGCQICHHQAPRSSNCAACHRPGDLAAIRALAVPIGVKDREPRVRSVGFAHQTHTELRCVTCHTQPVSLAPAEGVRRCADCHSDHHAAGRSCAACHTGPEIRTAHADDLAASHQRCDACHTASTVARFTPDRLFCATCHAEQAKDHYPSRECATCHFLESPAELRRRLTGPGRS